MPPAEFNHADSKSENWHRAKKIREVFSLNKSTRPLFFVAKNRVCFYPCLKTKIKFIKKHNGPRKFLKILHKKLHFFKFWAKILKQANGTLANNFLIAKSNADKNIIFLIIQAYYPRGSTERNMQQRYVTELKILYKSLQKKIKPKRNSYKINSNFKKGRRELQKSIRKLSNFEMMHFT